MITMKKRLQYYHQKEMVKIIGWYSKVAKTIMKMITRSPGKSISSSALLPLQVSHPQGHDLNWSSSRSTLLYSQFIWAWRSAIIWQGRVMARSVFSLSKTNPTCYPPTWCLEEFYHGNNLTGTVQEVFQTSLQRVRQAKLIIFVKFNNELTVHT